MHKAAKKIAVVLAAHGEAESPGFLENFRVSRRTLRHAASVMAMPPLLQIGISLITSLKKKFRPGYCGSPHNRITRELAARLQFSLEGIAADTGIIFDVHAAFTASDPDVEALIEMTSGYDGQILVSLSPVDSQLTCGQLCGYIAARRRDDELGRIKVMSRFWCDSRLHDLCADHVASECVSHGLDRSADNVLLLLFHGTLVSDSRGEAPGFRTGLHEVTSFAEQLSERIGSDVRHPYGRVMTAFLNHDVGGTWTSPSFEEAAGLLRCSGAANVTLFAAGYFADGNETIGREDDLRQVLHESRVRTIPCLNFSDAFVRYIGSKVTGSVSQLLQVPFPTPSGCLLQ